MVPEEILEKARGFSSFGSRKWTVWLTTTLAVLGMIFDGSQAVDTTSLIIAWVVVSCVYLLAQAIEDIAQWNSKGVAAANGHEKQRTEDEG